MYCYTTCTQHIIVTLRNSRMNIHTLHVHSFMKAIQRTLERTYCYTTCTSTGPVYAQCYSTGNVEDTGIVVVDAALVKYEGYATDLSNSVLARWTVKCEVTDQLHEVSFQTERRVVWFISCGLDLAQTTAVLSRCRTAV